MSETVIGGGEIAADERPEERQYIAVRLTIDEARYLNKRSRNRLSSGSCCPHLDVFHNEGRTSCGGIWRSCQVDGCGCLREDTGLRSDCYNCGFDPQLDKIARRQMATGVALGALSFGVLIGWLISSVGGA